MIREIGQDPEKTDTTIYETPREKKQVVVARPEEPSSFEQLIHTVVPVLEPLHRGPGHDSGRIHARQARGPAKPADRTPGQRNDDRDDQVLVDSAERLSRFLLNQLLSMSASAFCSASAFW